MLSPLVTWSLCILWGVAIFFLSYFLIPTPLPPPMPAKVVEPSCEFEGEDIFNNHVFDKTATLITDEITVPCNSCNNYVYKDNDGKCHGYSYDETYNVNGGGVQSVMSICTAEFGSTPCPIKSKNPPQK